MLEVGDDDGRRRVADGETSRREDSVDVERRLTCARSGDGVRLRGVDGEVLRLRRLALDEQRLEVADPDVVEDERCFELVRSGDGD